MISELGFYPSRAHKHMVCIPSDRLWACSVYSWFLSSITLQIRQLVNDTMSRIVCFYTSAHHAHLTVFGILRKDDGPHSLWHYSEDLLAMMAWDLGTLFLSCHEALGTKVSRFTMSTFPFSRFMKSKRKKKTKHKTKHTKENPIAYGIFRKI